MDTIDTVGTIGEPVTMSDILSLATWQRERSSSELSDFIERRLGGLPDDVTLD